MFAYRKPTPEEIDRAYEIAVNFVEWDNKTGPCPINSTDKYWEKKLCALFEWIAVLESDKEKFEKLEGGKK